MLNRFHKILGVFIFCSFSKLNGQGIFIANNENINISNGTISILGDVNNNGNLITSKNSTLFFNGLNWTNSPTSSMPSVDDGGLFIFDNSQVLGNGYLKQQTINGGFNANTQIGPGFPNIQINNPNGIRSIGFTDVQIKNLLDFSNGKYFANGNNIYIGDINKRKGTIINYTDKKYIVLDNTLNGAFLYLGFIEPKSNAVFPIGADSNYFTPAIINHSSITQTIKARSFNAVFEKAISGNWGNSNFVQTTWNISKTTSDTNSFILYLQHPSELEGNAFKLGRDNSFITHFNPIYNDWDTIPGAKPSIGSITTGQIFPSTFVNQRTFATNFGTNEYFSKSIELASVELGKNLDNIVKQIDGSFNLDFTFLVKNKGVSKINSIIVADNLQNVFPAGVEIKKLNLKSTGNLIINNNYTGIGIDTSLILANSNLMPGKVDSIQLSINADFHKISGTFYNTAILKATINNGTSYANTITRSSINGLNLNNNPTSTPIVIPSPVNGIIIPGGFSPNHDGINDAFVLGNTINYNITLQVFNRWGNKVYQSKGYYQNNWDGTCTEGSAFSNNEVVDGTYYYIIHVYDKITGALVENPIGFITIKRD